MRPDGVFLPAPAYCARASGFAVAGTCDALLDYASAEVSVDYAFVGESSCFEEDRIVLRLA